MTQALAAGIIAGGVYALVALAIVLIYRTTRILNVALGELATFALLVSWTVTESWDASGLVGVTSAIAAVVGISLAFERLVARKLRHAPPLAGLVATAGLATLLLGVEGKLWTADGRFFSDPGNPPAIDLGGFLVSGWEVATVVVAGALALLLMLLLYRTDLGLGIRAMADDVDAARGAGIPVDRSHAVVWTVAGALVAVAGLLLRPTIGFVAPGLLTGLFVRGLAAALVGGLHSLSGAVAGSIALGVVESGISYAFIDTSFDGIRSLVVLGVVLLVLVVRRRKQLVHATWTD